jgi:ssDNA-binding Zn-finger/Zn-ribbon topoisomerase 1
LNTFAALDWKLRIAVREQLRRDLENGTVPEDCLLKLDEVKQHLPMQSQGFSDFYTSLEHCQNCSGEMAEAKIPKNWFYVCSITTDCHHPRGPTSLMQALSPTTGPIRLQLPRILHPANFKHHPPTLKRLLLQRNRLGACLRPYEETRLRARDGLLPLQTDPMGRKARHQRCERAHLRLCLAERLVCA